MSFFHPLSDCKKFWLVGKVKLLFGVVPKTLRVSIHKEKKVFALIYICYSPAGRAVLGKTVPEVSSTARGRRPRAVLETEGTVFPNTDRPRPVNNIFIYF